MFRNVRERLEGVRASREDSESVAVLSLLVDETVDHVREPKW